MQRYKPQIGMRVLGVAGVLAAAAIVPPVHAQWIDAGGIANQMHQHDLLRDQTLRDPPDDGPATEADRNAPVGRGAAFDESAMKADIQRMIERRRRELLPEYERRVRNDGRASADDWLRRVAHELGRRDGAEIRARYGRR